MPLAHIVSPPNSGSSLALSTAPMAGVGRKVTSVCQLALSRTSVDGGVEDQHLRLLRHIRVDRVNMQVAEIGGESRLLLRRDRLVAEEQHLMLEQRLLDGVALFQVQRLADVDAADLRAEGGA